MPYTGCSSDTPILNANGYSQKSISFDITINQSILTRVSQIVLSET
jgi:hypothetical protein